MGYVSLCNISNGVAYVLLFLITSCCLLVNCRLSFKYLHSRPSANRSEFRGVRLFLNIGIHYMYLSLNIITGAYLHGYFVSRKLYLVKNYTRHDSD